MASELAKVGIGNIPGANALWVIDPTLTYGGQGATKENSWPTSGHFPVELATTRWSYSQQDAEFKDAKVEVSNQHGRVMDIVVYPQRRGYGDNTISWDLAGLTARDLRPEDTYVVSISNIGVPTEVGCWYECTYTSQSVTYKTTFVDADPN